MDQDFDSHELRGPARWWADFRDYWRDVYQTNALVRHLIHEPLFLGAIVAATLIALAVALLLPKRWHPAPQGFSKSVSVSLLDYLQAWALRRSGEKAVRNGRWDEALTDYRAAVANNLVDTAALRGVLGVLREAPWVRSANLGMLFTCGDLLLEITRTNRADALLVADVLERHRIAEAALERLRPYESDLTPEEDLVRTRALLGTGQITAFRERWKQHPDRFRTNAILGIYQATVDAGWGTAEQAVAGLETLRRAVTDPQTRPVAARLLAAAALQREDLVLYEQALELLHECDSMMAQDDTVWWELLARHDRREEARDLAKKYSRLPPPTGIELVQLGRTWLNLGLDEYAVRVFKDHAGRYGQSIEVWATYLDLLMFRNDWTEVHRLASDLRATTTSRDELLPVTLYADIRADLAEGRKTAVREPIRKLLEAPMPNPRLALRFASGLNAGGDHDAAWHFLSRIEGAQARSPDYWLEVIICARSRRDIETLLKGTDKLAELSPNNPSAQTIRLVILLGTRQLPAEALAISLRLVNAGIRSPSALINHAMALLANQRATEALTLLTELQNTSLSDDEVNSWYIAETDALNQLGRPAEALRFGEKVNAGVLLPPQEQWFRALLTECRTRAAAGKRS